MKHDQHMTLEQVAEVGRCQALLPVESDFKGRKGYYQRPKKDGGYTWGFRFKTHQENGRKTDAMAECVETMAPWGRATTERVLKNQAAQGRVTLKDGDGALRALPPALADTAARTHGWSHHWKARGVRVESGLEGHLFRCVGGAWKPTGRTCLGTPLRGSPIVPRRGVTHDPDGNPWRYVAGAWRRIG